MIFQTLFSEKALAKRAQREAVDAKLQVTAPHEWLFVSGLGVALFALFIYAMLGESEISLSTDAVLVQPGERVDVLANTTGVVDEVLAQIGDALAQGEAIARVRPPGTARIAREIEQWPEIPNDTNSQSDKAGINFMRDIVAPRDGVVASLSLVEGQRVDSGELVARLRGVSSAPPEVLAIVGDADALRLAPDMRAQVRVAVPGEEKYLILPVRVEHVSLRSAAPPAWMTELGLNAPTRGHLLRATLTEPSRQSIQDGTRGTLRIVIGQRSFASLLFGGDGN